MSSRSKTSFMPIMIISKIQKRYHRIRQQCSAHQADVCSDIELSRFTAILRLVSARSDASNLNTGIKIGAFGMLLGFTVSEPAYAYLDPGSVSLAVQAIVAGIAGAALTWKYWWHRVLEIFGLRKNRDMETNQEENEVSSLTESKISADD